jgi:hypothetical protein
MTDANLAGSQRQKEAKLPRRDWVLLPLLSLLTMLVLLASSEGVARVVWPERQKDACLVTDPVIGWRFRPNCKSVTKTAEGPWVHNFYNECGYRTRESCGPKPAGTIRVAVLGSSYSYGYMTPYDSAYTTLAGESLTTQCKRHVEFQNLGVVAMPLEDVYRRTQEALALKPDILLLSIDPYDVETFVTFAPAASEADSAPSAKSREAQGVSWIKLYVINPLKSVRSIKMLQHFMYRAPSTYVDLYLLYGDPADYLRPPFTSAWQRRLANVDALLQDMSKQAHEASVPMFILIGPWVAQGALMNVPHRHGVDPGAFEAAVAQIAAKDGMTVVNPLPEFAGQPHIMSLFYAVDGHPSPQGQRLVADALDKRLLSSGVPAFAGCSIN